MPYINDIVDNFGAVRRITLVIEYCKMYHLQVKYRKMHEDSTNIKNIVKV